jgi:hypothetical protein
VTLAHAERQQTPQLGARGTGFVLILGLLTGGGVGVVLTLLGGRIDGAVAIGIISALGVGIVARPLGGYYLLLFLAILADHELWYFAPWTKALGFYVFQNWWKLLSPEGVRWFGFLVVNTAEVLLLVIGVGLAVQMLRGGERPVVPREFVFALIYLGMLLGMLAYGLATGGALKPALWQTRYLFYFVVLALVTPQVLRTPAQVRGAVWVLGIATVFKALQIDWIFFVSLGARFGEWREILGHDDSVFFVGILALTAALVLYRAERVQRWVLLSSGPFVLMALVVNLRRASYVALVLSLGLVPVLLHGRRRAALKAALPVLVLFGLYGGLYWSRPDDRLGIPLQKLKSAVVGQVGTPDYGSNLYRVAENINLRRTITGHPFGLGFGHPFELRVPLDDISFLLPLWRYHPHNTILGMWMALGPVGFFVFLVYFGSILVLASHDLRRHTDPYLKAVSYFVLASFISALVVGMVDQYWNGQRGAVFLGALAGILSVLHRQGPGSHVEPPAAAPAVRGRGLP